MAFKNVVKHQAGEAVSDLQATQLGLSSERHGTVKSASGKSVKYTCKITHYADLPPVPVEEEKE